MAGQNFSIRTDAETLDELDRLAKARNRSRNFVVNEAIERYLVEERAWADKVRAGLAAAEAGDFASDAEIEALFGQFEARAGAPEERGTPAGTSGAKRAK